MNKSELALLIQKFRSGKATRSEKKILEEYWETAKTDLTPIENMPLSERIALKDETFHSIRQQLGFENDSKVKKQIAFNRTLYKVAATLLILISVAAALYLNNLPAHNIETAANVVNEIKTKFGERITVTLPDESTVILNGNSKIRYAQNWSENEVREVWIDGEGFFAVQHTKNHQKFIVHTREGLNVEVLGTKFNVKTREYGSEVLLTEGKVKLDVDNKSASSVYLNPGELATMNKRTLSKRVVKDTQYTSWVKSKLVFDKTPLEELGRILHDTYGLNVSFQDDELKQRQLSGEISSATADDILFAIAETFNIKVTKIDEGSVIFSSK
ncbi:FecR domain-containing protein [Chryseolinea sp. H1M3-3]|uniref:FecR family protein n=1 Tax=Chryseolinea sp. H1M3-3 TaxID=3034144 RepID=UPI0023ED97BA|nr:FecR domain-containing protein [Chryseolinea sp. H1M3-3]